MSLRKNQTNKKLCAVQTKENNSFKTCRYNKISKINDSKSLLTHV